MLNSQTSKYCQLLLFLARLEKTIELHRQNLCEIEAFEPYCTFRILDKESKNFITTSDLQTFLTSYGCFYDPKIIFSAFISRYDSNRDGVLSYPEFLKAVLPFEDPGLRTLVTQKPVSEKIADSLVEQEVTKTLATFLKEEITSFVSLLDKKRELFLDDDFSFEQVFFEIDSKATGLIDFKTIFDYFRKNSVFPYDEEIIAILHRFDSDGDGRLTVDDMKNFLKLLNPEEKIPTKIPLIEKNIIDKLHEAANNFFKSSKIEGNNVILQSGDLLQSDNLLKSGNLLQGDNLGKHQNNESPVKNSLSRFDYYPYEAVRKFNSPDKINSPLNYSQSNKTENGERSYLFESQMFPQKIVNNSKIDEKDKNELLDKLKEKPNSKEKIQYRNTIKPEAGATLIEGLAKKNKSIANSSELEKIKEDSTIMAIIHDVEQKNAFLKEIEEVTFKSLNEIQIPSSNQNKEFMQIFLRYLIKLVKSNEKLGEMKLDLVKKADFNLIDFFGFFDKNKKGYCTFEEFYNELKEQSTEIDFDILNILLKRFDRKNTQKLRFVDFERLFTTHAYKENDRKPINIRGFQFKYKELFSLDTRKSITKLIVYSTYVELELETLREDLNNFISQKGEKELFEELFEEIDQDQDSFISEHEIIGFLENYGFKIELNELQTLMRLLDQDKDGRISFLEFKFEYTQKKIIKEIEKNKVNVVKKTVVIQAEEQSENDGKKEKLKQSSLRKSLVQTKIEKKRESLVFDDEDAASGPSFLEYKSIKGIESPERKKPQPEVNNEEKVHPEIKFKIEVKEQPEVKDHPEEKDQLEGSEIKVDEEVQLKAEIKVDEEICGEKFEPPEHDEEQLKENEKENELYFD